MGRPGWMGIQDQDDNMDQSDDDEVRLEVKDDDGNLSIGSSPAARSDRFRGDADHRHIALTLARLTKIISAGIIIPENLFPIPATLLA